jgi:hypothetical protein
VLAPLIKLAYEFFDKPLEVTPRKKGTKAAKAPATVGARRGRGRIGARRGVVARAEGPADYARGPSSFGNALRAGQAASFFAAPILSPLIILFSLLSLAGEIAFLFITCLALLGLP